MNTQLNIAMSEQDLAVGQLYEYVEDGGYRHIHLGDETGVYLSTTPLPEDIKAMIREYPYEVVRRELADMGHKITTIQVG